MVYIMAIFAMLCWGIAPIFGKMALGQVSPMLILSLRTMVAFFLIFSFNITSNTFEVAFKIPYQLWIFIAIEALLATIVGDLAYFKALKIGNINDVTLIMASSPLITIACSYFFLSEQIYLRQIIGAALIIGGLFLVVTR